MNPTNMPRPTRRILATAAVAVVAATCVVSVDTASATAGHAKPGVTQATREWKAATPSTKEVVMATREWKESPLKTKEW